MMDMGDTEGKPVDPVAKVVTLHEVYETDCEGRSKTRTVGLFTDKKIADAVCGESRNYASISAVKAVEVRGSYYVLDIAYGFPAQVNVDLPKLKKEVREKALKKLTPYEREVLGIRDSQ